METFYQVLAIIIGPVVGILAYGLIERKRQAKTKARVVNEPDEMLDDVSYIEEIVHLHGKVGIVEWQQYDVILATQHYGWETMVDWADYMESADIESIESLTIIQHILTDEEHATNWNPFEEIELAHVYNQNKVGLKNFERLKEDQARLSIYGRSRTLNDAVKIVWFNQTRGLRIFTHINNETLITRYAETLIRRTFGTKDAMKLAKPIPKNDTTQPK